MEEDCIDLTMNQTVKELRQLLYGQCVVALDTNILSALESEIPPKWFEQFVEMRESGVRFSIPDLCVGERLNCFEHADESGLDDIKMKWHRTIDRLNYIIWQELPCLPLRGDLYDLVGIKERGKQNVRMRPFSIEVAKRLYRHLSDYENSRFNTPSDRDCMIAEFKKVRREWKIWILDWRNKSNRKSAKEMCDNHIADLYADFVSPEGITKLFELPVRFAAECAADKRYNPTDDDDCCCQEKKSKPSNDGLDFAILFLTMASINICSYDRLFKRVGRMKFDRANCCHRPETIYEKWQEEKLPYVVVPLPIQTCV